MINFSIGPEANDNNLTLQSRSQPNQGRLGMGRSVVQTSHVVQSDLAKQLNINLPNCGEKGSVTEFGCGNGNNLSLFLNNKSKILI